MDGNEMSISGPSILGFEGHIHGPNLQGTGIEEKALKTADALAHLFRFCQIYELRGEASSEAVFNIVLSKQSSPRGPLNDGQELQYTFKNVHSYDLYLTVLTLGPGFQVGQRFPPENMPERNPSGRQRTFSIIFSIPYQLRDGQPYRDIIRTVVTSRETQGFKSLELPDIWDAATMEFGMQEGFGRDASFRDSSFVWWTKDDEVYTER